MCNSCKTRVRRQKHAELRSLNLVWKDGKVSSVNDSSTEGEGDSDGTGDERGIRERSTIERALKRSSSALLTHEDTSTDKEDMSRDAESNCLQSVSSVDSIASEDGPSSSPMRDPSETEQGYPHANQDFEHTDIASALYSCAYELPRE